MALSREEIKEALGQLPVLELVELINELENDWGVSAAAPVAAAAAAGAAGDNAAAAEEQTEFEVVLKSFGENKVGVIKVVRAITAMGLKGAPSTIKESASKDEAASIKKDLEEAGATVDVK
jgi:large subunit ribosomal protein L7/L12